MSSGLDWIVSRDTVVRPDVMVVCGDQPRKHLERAPGLVIEVLSPATEAKDRTAKRELYEACGVSWYLMADPAARSIEVLGLVDGRYTSASLEEPSTLRLPNECQFRLEAEQLFR